MPDGRSIPNFLYIGAPKSGSSWLFEALRAHPEVFVPEAKDLQFFDKFYDKGWEWYQQFFRGRDTELAIGEISHDYYLCPEAPKRIFEHLPTVRIICCLREPGDLTLSAYRYSRNHIGEHDVGLEAYSELPIAGQQIAYTENLERYYRLFPQENMHVVFFDELCEDPVQFLSGIYRFIAVQDDFQPNVLHQRVNSAKVARFANLAKAAYGVAGILRQHGLANVVGAVKRNRMFDALLYSQNAQTQNCRASPREAAVVHEIRVQARATYSELEALIGRPVPPAWKG